MFSYCNNNPVRFTDSDGAAPEEEISAIGYSYSVDEKFHFVWGTVTVIASYEVKIVEGCTFALDTIEVEVSNSDVSVTMPDGTSFCFEYDWTGIKPDCYTKTISEELGLEMVLDVNGLGISISNDTMIGAFELQVQVRPNPVIALIEKVAEALPPVGGSHGGGPWDIHNKTLMFK